LIQQSIIYQSIYPLSFEKWYSFLIELVNKIHKIFSFPLLSLLAQATLDIQKYSRPAKSATKYILHFVSLVTR